MEVPYASLVDDFRRPVADRGVREHRVHRRRLFADAYYWVALLNDQELAALKRKASELFDNGNSDAAFGDTPDLLFTAAHGRVAVFEWKA